MKEYKCVIAKQMYKDDINKALAEMVKEGFQLIPFSFGANILIFEKEIENETEQLMKETLDNMFIGTELDRKYP